MANLYSTTVQTGELATVKASSGAIATHEYLVLYVPPSNTCQQVVSITIKCSSHDQGSADQVNDSYSWVDAVLRSNDGKKEIYRKSRVFVNPIGNKDFVEHSVKLEYTDDLIEKCQPGKTKLVLELNAQYPEWQNIARSGELVIQYN